MASWRATAQSLAPREAPHADRIGVPAQHPRGIDDVLDGVVVHDRTRLGLERPAALSGLEHDPVPAVQEHRRLEAGAGPKARVHEHHRQHLPLEAAGHLAALDPRGKRSSPSTSSGLQSSRARKSRLVTPAPPRVRRGADRPRAWEKESGGRSRRTCGSVAVPVRTLLANSARWTSTAGRSRCRPRSRPRPATRRTPSASRAPRELIADRDRVGDEPVALDHGDVGQRRRAGHGAAAEGAAEVAQGERIGERAAIATTAPIGRPPARPLANVSASGVTPNDSAALNAPQRPTPHCTSSNSSTAPRSSQSRRAASRNSGGAVPRAGEALHRLDQHRRHGIIDRRVERRDVVERRSSD